MNGRSIEAAALTEPENSDMSIFYRCDRCRQEAAPGPPHIAATSFLTSSGQTFKSEPAIPANWKELDLPNRTPSGRFGRTLLCQPCVVSLDRWRYDHAEHKS